MSTLSDLYARGAGDEGPVIEPGTVLPDHALAAIRRADALARALHRDVTLARVRPTFKRYWGEFYNRWLVYRTLYATRETQADPARVLEVDVPKFIANMYEWRDALVAEGGQARSSASLAGETAAPSEGGGGFPWRPTLVLLGLGVAGLGLRYWWRSRQARAAANVAPPETAILPPPPAASAMPVIVYPPAVSAPPSYPLPSVYPPWAPPPPAPRPPPRSHRRRAPADEFDDDGGEDAADA